MRKSMKRAAAMGMAVLMACSTAFTDVSPVQAAKTAGARTLMDSFTDPDGKSNLMARFWFPDAAAGYDSGKGDYIDLVREQIDELADAGFGGVEMTMLADNANLFWQGKDGAADNETAGNIGWGSEAWAKMIAAALDTANNREEPFRVDVTITAHWPMVINTIDPNDDNQQQELAVADVQKITPDMLADNVVTELNRPRIAGTDKGNSDSMCSTFIRKDTLVSAVAAKVASVDKDGKVVLDADTIKDVSATEAENKGYTVGIPKGEDDGTARAAMAPEKGKDGSYSWKYYTEESLAAAGFVYLTKQTPIDKDGCVIPGAEVKREMLGDGMPPQFVIKIVDKDGKEITDASYLESGIYVKAIKEGDKTRYDSEDAEAKNLIRVYNTDLFEGSGRQFMDETSEKQAIYTATADALNAVVDKTAVKAGDEIQAGDYVLVNTYRRGTGQIQSGGSDIKMKGKTYAVDYFTPDGAQEVIDYWNKNMLEVEYKCADGQNRKLKDLMKANGDSYIFEDSIELSHEGLLWSKDLLTDFKEDKGYELGKYAAVLAGKVSTDDTEAMERIEQDYKAELSTLYAKNHLEKISAWTEGFGYGFRAQCHGIDAVDANEAALAADIAESDNATDGYGTRMYAAAVNVDPDKTAMSDEALTFGTGFSEFPSWYYCVNTMNRYFSEGVNRIILHGTPFKKAVGDYVSQWPGWDFGSFMAWNARQTWWEDVDIISDYVNRVQSVTENGQSKVPVAVLVDPTISNITSVNRGVALDKHTMQAMIGEGYNYNIITKALVESDLMTTVDGSKSLSGNVVLSENAEYQTLVLSDITCMSEAAMEKIVAFAEAGVQVIDMNCDIRKVYGTDKGDTTEADKRISALYEKLQKAKGYVKAEGADEPAREKSMMAAIRGHVKSGVSYKDERADKTGHTWLEATRIYDKANKTNYYMLYNESGISVGAEQDKAFGPAYYEENGDIRTTAVLAGEGVPYRLDPTDGSVTKITDYEKTADGVKVPVDIDEGDLYFIVISKDGSVASTAKEEAAKTEKETIALGGSRQWDLTLESWEPDDSKENTTESGSLYDPTQSKKTLLEGIKTTLVPWSGLALTDGQLAKAGVEEASEISGVGYYTTEVDVPDYGKDYDVGGVLNYTFDRQYNCLTNVTVENSQGVVTKFHANNPNHAYLDLGTALTPGKNRITLEVSGDLSARDKAENPNAGGGGIGGGPGGGGFPGGGGSAKVENGLTDASLKLYTTGNANLAQTAENEKAEAAQTKKEAEALKAQAEQLKKEAEAAKAEAESMKKAAEQAAQASGADSNAAKKAKAAYEEAQRKADAKAAEAEKQLKAAKNLEAKVKFSNGKITLKSVKSAKKKTAKVTWKKVSGASGYQIQYATKSNFKGKKTAYVKKGKATSTTINKLKSGKKYYVRVRAYKTIDGKKVYGNYSVKKSVKVK